MKNYELKISFHIVVKAENPPEALSIAEEMTFWEMRSNMVDNTVYIDVIGGGKL